MSQQRKLSRHNSRQSSIGETTSVGSSKSDAKSVSGSSGPDYGSSSNGSSGANNNKTLSRHHGSQDSGGTTSGSSGGNSANSKQAADIKLANVLNVAEMLLHGVADNEILDIWLKSIQCEEFVSKFIDAGYDMPTISRITPQDLTAIGVTEPTKRLKILTEIKKLNLQDGIPTFRPASLSHWLSLIRLDSYYYKSLCDQQVDTIEKLCQLTWEDFEELGIQKLGHQKRFQLAIERIKELDAESKFPTKTISEPIYDTSPSQILLVASTENHSMNGPIITKQSSTGELSSTGSGSMHSVYSAASTHYQPTYAPLPDNNQLIVGQAQQQQQQQAQPMQQQRIYSQPPQQSLIYQQPSQLLSSSSSIQQQQAQHQHFLHHPQLQPVQPPQIPKLQQFINGNNHQPSMASNNNHNGLINGTNIVPQQIVNRQSMGQLPFSALANLPKHQQQLLQQSSIYATLSRQPAKAKQPPPPVPIRTNSLKTNSLTDETCNNIQQQLELNNYQSQQQQQQQHSNSNSSGSTCSLFRSGTNRVANRNNANQFNSQTMLTKNKSFSGNAHMEASRARFLKCNNDNNAGGSQQQQFPHLATSQQTNTSSSVDHQYNCSTNNQQQIYGQNNTQPMNGLMLDNNNMSGAIIKGSGNNNQPIITNNNLFNCQQPANNNNFMQQQATNHHHYMQQSSLPKSSQVVNNNNNNNNNIHHNQKDLPLYHPHHGGDDLDLQSDANSTKSLILPSSSSSTASSVITSPLHNHHLKNNNNNNSNNNNQLNRLSGGDSTPRDSGSSQTLYNSASSGGSNEQNLNMFNNNVSSQPSSQACELPGSYRQHQSTAASSCTLNDLGLSDRLQQQVRSLTATNNINSLNLLPSAAPTAQVNKTSATTNGAQFGSATTGKDDEFPPPPSPLSIADIDEHELVSLTSDTSNQQQNNNFSDVTHAGLMTFRNSISDSKVNNH